MNKTTEWEKIIVLQQKGYDQFGMNKTILANSHKDRCNYINFRQC